MKNSFPGKVPDPVFERVAVVNGTRSNISKGDPVYATGYSGKKPLVAFWIDGEVAIGVMAESIEPDETGQAMVNGIISIDTSSFSDGAILYASSLGLAETSTSLSPQAVGVSLGSDLVLVRIGPPTPLSEILWGGITGTLSDNTDLQAALDAKVDGNTAIIGATKTKVTYDEKGLVVSGADATTADIADSLNKRYVTDAQLAAIFNPGYSSKSANYTLVATDCTVDATAPLTFTLLTSVGLTGRPFNLCNSSGGLVTVNTTSSQTIYLPGGAVTSVVLNDGESLAVQSTGSNWRAL